MGRAARLILLASLAFLFVGGTARAGELELIERLPGAIDDHTIVMLDGSRAILIAINVLTAAPQKSYA